MFKPMVLLLLFILPLHTFAVDDETNNTSKLTLSYPISQQRIFDQDLTKYHDANEVAWLGDKDTRFLTLWREQSTAQAVGTSWIFGDTYTSANNPNIIQTLRYELNNKGLHTYSISPLSQGLNSEQAELRLQQQLLVLQDKIVSQDGKRLLILQGANCQAMVNVLVNNPNIYVDAIVLLSAHSPTLELAFQLNKHINQLKMPILDIFAQTDSLNIIDEAKTRKTTARRLHNINYRQTEVIGLQGQVETKLATSQIIYGWLVKLGWY